jgi:predicted small metal-binding protein
MKSISCRQLGGPCDLELQGNSADEVIKLQDAHLKQMMAAGDEAHKSASKAMKGRWRHPLSGMAWYKQAKLDFAALPEH